MGGGISECAGKNPFAVQWSYRTSPFFLRNPIVGVLHENVALISHFPKRCIELVIWRGLFCFRPQRHKRGFRKACVSTGCNRWVLAGACSYKFLFPATCLNDLL